MDESKTSQSVKMEETARESVVEIPEEEMPGDLPAYDTMENMTVREPTPRVVTPKEATPREPTP